MIDYGLRLFLIVIGCLGLSSCLGQKTLKIITNDNKELVFDIDVARTKDEQTKGLMFVEKMPAEKGMIFVYPLPQVTQFWMKNTLIPLDMLFFDDTNTLVHIEHSATPHDETPRGPLTPICSVFEVNGGMAKQLNIEVGAKIITNLTQECLQSSMK